MDKNVTQDIVKNGKIAHAGFVVTLWLDGQDGSAGKSTGHASPMT